MQEVASVLRERDILVRLAPTLRRGHAQELAQAAIQEGAQLVLACGGDGTINEVVNGIAPASVPLGILPAGTANIAAKELKLPHHPVHAAQQLPSWLPHRIPLGRATWPAPAESRGASPPTGGSEPAWAGRPRLRYFLSVAGIGFDAYVIHKLYRGLQSSVGVGSYIHQALRQVWRYAFPQFVCWVDGKKFQATSAMVQRTSRYAGWLKLAPEAHLFEPMLTLCAFQSASRARYFLYAAAVVLRQHARMSDVQLLPAQKVACSPVDSDVKISFELDGELAGELPASFELVPDAFTILAP